MDKKILLGVVIVAVIAVLAIGFVAANNFGPGKNFFGKNWNNKNMTQEQIQEMQNLSQQINTAIKNNDFTTWKSLMESQLTQNNFNKLVARYQNMSQEKQKGFPGYMGGRGKIGNFTGERPPMTGNFTGEFRGHRGLKNMNVAQPGF